MCGRRRAAVVSPVHFAHDRVQAAKRRHEVGHVLARAHLRERLEVGEGRPADRSRRCGCGCRVRPSSPRRRGRPPCRAPVLIHGFEPAVALLGRDAGAVVEPGRRQGASAPATASARTTNASQFTCDSRPCARPHSAASPRVAGSWAMSVAGSAGAASWILPACCCRPVRSVAPPLAIGTDTPADPTTLPPPPSCRRRPYHG